MQVESLKDLMEKLGQSVYVVVPTGKMLTDRVLWSTHSRIVEWVVKTADFWLRDASGNLEFEIKSLLNHEMTDERGFVFYHRGGIFTTYDEALMRQAEIALVGEFSWPVSGPPKKNIAST